MISALSFQRKPMKNTKVNFVNLTPHKITLRGKSDQIIEPSGKVARVESKEYSLGATANGVPIVSRDFEDVQGLPNPRNFAWTAAETEGTGSPRIAKPGELAEITIYIVSNSTIRCPTSARCSRTRHRRNSN